MAQLNFDSISNYSENASNVGFFGLKQDKEEAIVRIIADSTNDFDIVTCHPITENGKFRTVNCIGDNCPLCASGNKASIKFYVHLIHYVRNDDGTITGVPKVWQRSLGFARELRNYINEYGPLTNCLFKITRNGKPKDTNTTYSLMFCNPAVYNDSAYPMDLSAFENYKAIGRAVLNKTAQEMETFVATGAFPQAGQNNSADVNSDLPFTFDSSSTETVNNSNNMAPPINNMPNNFSTAPGTSGETPTAPWMNNQTVNRPQRTY